MIIIRFLTLIMILILSGCSTGGKFRIDISNPYKVVVLVYPEEILTRAAITPEEIEKTYEQKKVIYSSDTPRWKRFVDALTSTKLTPSSQTGDYRWSIHIHSSSNEVVKVYIDRLAKIAEVNGKNFNINDRFLNWIKSEFL